MHPSDKHHALKWAASRAEEAGKTDEFVRLKIAPDLKKLRDEAEREARGRGA